MEDDKPVVADASEVEESTVETQGADESLEDLFEDEAGSTDVVPEAPDSKEVFKAEMEAVSGRTFKSYDDAVKHYKNLSSYVGKKAEPEKQPASDPSNVALDKLAALEARLEERDLVSENPEAKEHMTLIRAVAKDKGISITEAFGEIKDTIAAASAYKKEREIGVSSKSRISPAQSQVLKRAVETLKANPQSYEAQAQVVEEWFKRK